MTDEKKYELIEKLVHTEDELLLNQVKAILDGSDIDLWNDLNPKLKASINRALDQSKKGIGMVHEDIMNEYRARFKK
ncbi:MAG: hypothetical protein HYR67_09180 [Bacteroidetes bacterium]|nr:hypothetical protein [Bacteroidota bacterium]